MVINMGKYYDEENKKFYHDTCEDCVSFQIEDEETFYCDWKDVEVDRYDDTCRCFEYCNNDELFKEYGIERRL